jgi:hypothetical protein
MFPRLSAPPPTAWPNHFTFISIEGIWICKGVRKQMSEPANSWQSCHLMMMTQSGLWCLSVIPICLHSLSTHAFLSYYWEICRHPRGQHEQWAEDGRKRVKSVLSNEHLTITRIHVDLWNHSWFIQDLIRKVIVWFVKCMTITPEPST